VTPAGLSTADARRRLAELGPKFVPLPPAYFAFLAAASVTYLMLVEIVKRRLMRCLVAPLADGGHLPPKKSKR
jgi:hypothetical protein